MTGFQPKRFKLILKDTRTFVGSYDYHLVRANGDWKIDSFRYNSQFVDGNLKL